MRSGSIRDTTAVAGSTRVTPAAGSTVTRTVWPLVGEVLHRDWMPFDEQPQQRHEQAGIEPGPLGADEAVGQASCQVCGVISHRDLLGSVIGGRGRVCVHAQHERSDGSVVKALAAIRMPSAMVR